MATPVVDRRQTIARAREITRVAARHGFGYAFERRPMRRQPPPGQSDATLGRHLREFLDELGPTFVKFGQLLSTRPDLVPEDVAAELVAAAGLGVAVLVRAGSGGDRSRAGRSAGHAVRIVRPGPDRGGIDRSGASGRAPEWPPGRGQSAAAGGGRAGRIRPGAALPDRATCAKAGQAAPVHGHGGSGGRVRALDQARAGLPHRGSQCRAVPAQLRRGQADRDPAGVLDILQRAGADAGVAGGAQAARGRSRHHRRWRSAGGWRF